MHVGPIIAVTDLVRARRFYEHALGLDDHETPGGWVVGADVPFDLDADGIPGDGRSAGGLDAGPGWQHPDRLPAHRRRVIPHPPAV